MSKNKQTKAKSGDEAKPKGDAKSENEAKVIETPPAGNNIAESAFHLSSLAATLMTARFKEIRKQTEYNKPFDLSDPRLDLEFDGALKRASMMIRQTSERNFDVDAYQVFKEGVVMSAESIADEFSRIRWKGLTNIGSVKKLMKPLMKQMERHAEQISGTLQGTYPITAIEAYDIVTETMRELCETSEVISAYPDFANQLTRFMESLAETRAPSSTVAIEKSVTYECFKKYCFPLDEVKNIQRYLPHEIFRFAASQNWQSPTLTNTLSSLSPTFYPYPTKPLDFFLYEAFNCKYPPEKIYKCTKNSKDST